jgi:hypothetical protein
MPVTVVVATPLLLVTAVGAVATEVVLDVNVTRSPASGFPLLFFIVAVRLVVVFCGMLEAAIVSVEFDAEGTTLYVQTVVAEPPGLVTVIVAVLPGHASAGAVISSSVVLSMVKLAVNCPKQPYGVNVTDETSPR